MLVAQDPQSLTSPFRELGQYARKPLLRNCWQNAVHLSLNALQPKRAANRRLYRKKLITGKFGDCVSSFAMAIFAFDPIQSTQAKAVALPDM
ncbi:hypothetical protein PUN49_02660 [Pseudomonas extremaustralis]|uniref:hypothetical protein n=1 Tax=Pseudomonas extremaustralis TaxID=359110 RepID=UPI0023080ECA|nr:hypothetical protein [Pseudomonas extremaustralis]MDB1108722.1 hypothetical protein [Pseudomonas extremaustralis]MDG2965943.1 hypothetical protein [Pseudomonas extremaustralis]